MVGSETYYLTEKTMVGARYQISKVIGEGGFGITYVGHDMRLNIAVAIKEYFPKGFVQRSVSATPYVAVTIGDRRAVYEKGKERFLNEARVIAKFIGEPGIVNVTDYFEENNTAYIVMEYLNGITLKDYVEKYGNIPSDTIFNLMNPLIKTLNLVHRQGLIHRDISPDNIMLMPDGNLKLLDFGAAKDYSMMGQESMTVVLKRGYAPEEQYRSRGVQGPWTDIYALCATIYKCITGITPDESIQRMRQDDIKWPSETGILISRRQEYVLMRGMEIEAQRRFQTVEELAGYLSGVYELGRQEKTQESKKEPNSVEAARKSEQAGSVFGQRKGLSRKQTKNRLFLIVGILSIVILAWAGFGRGLLRKETITEISYPTERVMSSDAAYILKSNGIDEPVMNLKIRKAEENEKYQFYTVDCIVTVGRGENSEDYRLRLIYEWSDNKWRLSSQSEMKDE